MTDAAILARLATAQQQLTAPTPVPLAGQTDIALDWTCPPYDQEPLWMPPTTPPAPETSSS